ncbi:MAG: type IV pilin [Candidatus Nezhaarchaeota archaeon]|nr:type IV pilin [Candidatus Nezhaarchaeota archaeon]
MSKLRRGVSPVIATLLLIVIAVACAAILYTWAMGYASMRPTAPEVAEKLKIETGNLTRVGRDARAVIYVRNIGGAASNITHAYLLNAAGELINGTAITPPVSISPGAVAAVRVTWRGAITVSTGYTYMVRLITALGNEINIELKALP